MNRSGQRRSRTGTVVAVAGILFSILYLLNLTFGVDLLPDNLPIVGNIDEATATGLLLACLRYLGVDVLRFVPGHSEPGEPGAGQEK
ncbi:MAG: DUF1232 domain-containing protein [Planctomycetota bacterium]